MRITDPAHSAHCLAFPGGTTAIEDALQEMLAKAWDEGFTDGREDVYGGDHPNPYRKVDAS